MSRRRFRNVIINIYATERARKLSTCLSTVRYTHAAAERPSCSQSRRTTDMRPSFAPRTHSSVTRTFSPLPLTPRTHTHSVPFGRLSEIMCRRDRPTLKSYTPKFRIFSEHDNNNNNVMDVHIFDPHNNYYYYYRSSDIIVRSMWRAYARFKNE